MGYCRESESAKGASGADVTTNTPAQVANPQVFLDTVGGVLKAPSYPCYVMSLRCLQRYARLPTHEQALHDRSLKVLTQLTYHPCRSHCHFVSHVWLSKEHPDGEPDMGNPKLTWMQTVAPELLGDASFIFFWMDYFSVSQQNREYQQCALKSLPNYALVTGNFLPLVSTPHDVESYRRRGWCQLECLSALSPKVTQHGAWRTGPAPMSRRFRFFRGDTRQDDVMLFNWETLKNPSDSTQCDFTCEDDRDSVFSVQVTIAQLMQLYESSGSRSYHHTLRIEDRPLWLKLLGTTDTRGTCG